ncbi:YdiK family protein [Peribacillus kribbensis]|uniref:YdiK family protein n=1 Tax=Peribacillus kribbensis TaxID=356658 RepID=UPI0003FFBF53|nr:YdiK family protein [Peribacillus kribbensis]
MTRRSPLIMALIYFALGVLFTVFATQNVSQNGWGFFSYFLVFLATLDFASALRMAALHFKIRKLNKK